MTATRHAHEIVRHMRLGDFRSDVGTFVAQVLCDSLEEPDVAPLDWLAIDRHLFPVRRIATDAIEAVTEEYLEHGPEHAMQIPQSADPIVVASGALLDGRHRVYRAQTLGEAFVEAIDLTGFVSQRIVAMNFGGRIAALATISL